jgi:hypothetical protein
MTHIHAGSADNFTDLPMVDLVTRQAPSARRALQLTLASSSDRARGGTVST